MNEIIQTIPAGYIPSYFLYIVSGVIFLSFIVITALYKSKKTNWGNFWKVVLFSTLISAILIGILTLKPEVIVNAITSIGGLFA